MKRLVLSVVVAAAAVSVCPTEPRTVFAQTQDRSADRSSDAREQGAAPRRPPGEGGSRRGGGRPGGGGIVAVAVDAVIKGPVFDTVPVYGRLVARNMGPVAARARGAVAEMLAFVGDRVEKGQTLALLVRDSLIAERDLKAAELAEFKASVATARAQLDLARQELARLNQLRQSSAFPRARYDDQRHQVARFQSALAGAESKVEQAQAELRLAEINLAYAVITAPYAGVVSRRHTEVGAFLNVGDPVVTLINDRELEVEAEIPSARLAGLDEGTTISAEFEDGVAFQAAVRAVVPEENPLARTRTARLTADFTGLERRIGVNENVLLMVPVGAPREAVSVHKDAILRREGRTIVFVLEDGRARLRPVSVGAAVGGRLEVIGGLEPGERVVVRGNERLSPDQPIRERQAAPS